MAKSRKGRKLVPTPTHVNAQANAPSRSETEAAVYADAAAEPAFLNLPARVEEDLAVVRYTGRKRAYIHFGRAGDGATFWYLIRSDGPRLLKVYPPAGAEKCFSEMLSLMDGWRSSVNSDPMSPSYCDIAPDEQEIVLTVRKKYLPTCLPTLPPQ